MGWIPWHALRLVAAAWPLLLGIYLAGYLVHYLVIDLAGWIGSTSALAAFFILPIAILARVASFICMFLVLRSHMRAFTAAESEARAELEDHALEQPVPLAPPEPSSAQARFWEVLTASILPFIAFYTAWGFLADDVAQYASDALSQAWGPVDPVFGRGLTLGLNPLTIGVTVLAYTGRHLLRRYAGSLAGWTRFVSAYLETVWVFLAALVVQEMFALGGSWVGDRALVVWWDGVREHALSTFDALDWIWNAVSWLLGEAAGLLFLPLAWLTIAGVVYGRAIAAQKLDFVPVGGRAGTIYALASKRITGLPSWLRARGNEVFGSLAGRVKPLTASVLLMWRAGAVPLGVFVLAYTALEAGSGWLASALLRAIGPHAIDFWFATSPILVFLVALVLEPLRIALVAAAYDYSLAALERRRTSTNDTSSVVEAIAGTDELTSVPATDTTASLIPAATDAVPVPFTSRTEASGQDTPAADRR
ncbi:hypothetical protein [Glaciibacter superstes]|uniref:hypothetical protein n=1 Tax=Glaciibacter superstes TaxID=501023 RepID=UPI0012FA6615|nr:hypothetical protein [Glaciibacter superstes]